MIKGRNGHHTRQDGKEEGSSIGTENSQCNGHLSSSALEILDAVLALADAKAWAVIPGVEVGSHGSVYRVYDCDVALAKP